MEVIIIFQIILITGLFKKTF